MHEQHKGGSLEGVTIVQRHTYLSNVVFPRATNMISVLVKIRAYLGRYVPQHAVAYD